jgi:hypothetical protein
MIQGTAYDFNSSCPRFSVRNVKIVGIGHSELVLVYDGPPQADFAGVKTAAAELRKWLLRQEPWINFSTSVFAMSFKQRAYVFLCNLIEKAGIIQKVPLDGKEVNLV